MNLPKLPKELRCYSCNHLLKRVKRPALMRLIPGSAYFQCQNCSRGSILRVFGFDIPL